jgi:PmbA/TldA metallopeptidase C-terminal domain
MKNLKIYIALVLFVTGYSISAQETKKILHQAMETEISRNMQNLHLTGMKDPFYIGLNIADYNTLAIQSSLGTLIKITEYQNRICYNNQVLVGDYTSNNLNYTDPKASTYFFRTSVPFPVDNNLNEIQRKLWMTFDNAYKLAAETYESKQSTLKSKPLTEDMAGLPDYTKGEKVLIEKPENALKFTSDKLIQYANDISITLKPYKYLTTSWVRIVGYKGNIYYSNSEGTKATYPVSLLRVVVNVETQAENGELFEQYQIYHAVNEADLPSKEQVIKDAKILADNVLELKNAAVFDDVYTGPVLFEDQAATETMRKTMFYAKNENLYSARKPVVGGTSRNSPITQNVLSTEDRIDKKVASDGLNVKDKTGMTVYNGIQLVGSYPIDMEGVVPSQETILIENGVLKNLLCGRIPTSKMKASNGHLRVPLNFPNPIIVPGVIEVDYNNSISREELRKKLIEMAQSEGLDYALIVREMTPNMSELRKVYKVDVKTGKEQLVRSVGFKGLTMNDLRKIVGASNQKRVLNTTAGEDIQHKFDYLSGCPATYITPDAFLFKDLEISKSVKAIMTRVPFVKNPAEL